MRECSGRLAHDAKYGVMPVAQGSPLLRSMYTDVQAREQESISF